MIGVYAERISVAFISSAAAVNALRMISVVIGSTRSWRPSGLLSDRASTSAPKASTRSVAPGGTTVVAVVLVDDRRPVDDGARRELVRGRRSARRAAGAVEDRRARAAGRCASGAPTSARRRLGAAEVAERRRAHDDELDRRAGVGVAVAGLVRLVEARPRARSAKSSPQRLAGAVERDRQRVLLARRSGCRAHARTRPRVARDALLGRGSAKPSRLELGEAAGERRRGRRRRAAVKYGRLRVLADLASRSMPQAENAPG